MRHSSDNDGFYILSIKGTRVQAENARKVVADYKKEPPEEATYIYDNNLPVLFDFLREGTVDKFPTLIVGGFTVIAAVQFFFAGMILKTIVLKGQAGI